MAPRLSCTLITGCALLLLSLLLSCDEVNGGIFGIADKLKSVGSKIKPGTKDKLVDKIGGAATSIKAPPVPKSSMDKIGEAGKAASSRFQLFRKKDKLLDTAGDAAGNIRPPEVVASVSKNAESSMAKIGDAGKAASSRFQLFKKKDKLLDTAGDAAGNIRPPEVVASVSKNAESSIAKVGDVVSDASKVGTAAASGLSRGKKAAIGTAAALGVGTAAVAAVALSQRGKDKAKDGGGQPEVKAPLQGIAENPPEKPKVKRRIVAEGDDDE